MTISTKTNQPGAHPTSNKKKTTDIKRRRKLHKSFVLLHSKSTTQITMFKILFAVFALVAMAFAAPNPNPAVYAAGPLAYSSLGYAAAPAVAYGHVGAVPAYGAYGAYPYAASPVVYG